MLENSLESANKLTITDKSIQYIKFIKVLILKQKIKIKKQTT